VDTSSNYIFIGWNICYWLNSSLPTLVVRKYGFSRPHGWNLMIMISDSESPQNLNQKTYRPTYCGVTLSNLILGVKIFKTSIAKEWQARYEKIPSPDPESAHQIGPRWIYGSCHLEEWPNPLQCPNWFACSMSYSSLWRFQVQILNLLTKPVRHRPNPLHSVRGQPNSHFSHHQLIWQYWVLQFEFHVSLFKLWISSKT